MGEAEILQCETQGIGLYGCMGDRWRSQVERREMEMMDDGIGE